MNDEDKCMLCPTGFIHTQILGRDHIHDHCDGCSYRLCMNLVPCTYLNSGARGSG